MKISHMLQKLKENFFFKTKKGENNMIFYKTLFSMTNTKTHSLTKVSTIINKENLSSLYVLCG